MHWRVDGPAPDAVPGPGTYSHSVSNSAPKFTISARREPAQDLNTAPYSNLPPTFGAGPKVSFAGRHPELADINTPGPSYVPPALVDTVPKVGIARRDPGLPDQRASYPGPGHYEISPRFAKEARTFTLKGRPVYEKPNPSPGPAAYSPDFRKTSVNPPAVSIGVRPPDRPPDENPAPGVYPITRDLNGRRVSMGWRVDGPPPDAVPGPGAYSHSVSNSAPKFTISARREPAQDLNTAPYSNLPPTFGAVPKISLSGRHPEQAPNVPGPTYVPPGLVESVPKVQISPRLKDLVDPRVDNPGPGHYEVPPKFAKDARQFTMKGRTSLDPEDKGPGPGAYSPDFTKTGVAVPVPKIHERLPEKRPEKRPDPGALPSTLGGPKFTIAGKGSTDVIPR
jgi:hypothetical protein